MGLSSITCKMEKIVLTCHFSKLFLVAKLFPQRESYSKPPLSMEVSSFLWSTTGKLGGRKEMGRDEDTQGPTHLYACPCRQCD